MHPKPGKEVGSLSPGSCMQVERAISVPLEGAELTLGFLQHNCANETHQKPTTETHILLTLLTLLILNFKFLGFFSVAVLTALAPTFAKNGGWLSLVDSKEASSYEDREYC